MFIFSTIKGIWYFLYNPITSKVLESRNTLCHGCHCHCHCSDVKSINILCIQDLRVRQIDFNKKNRKSCFVEKSTSLGGGIPPNGPVSFYKKPPQKWGCSKWASLATWWAFQNDHPLFVNYWPYMSIIDKKGMLNWEGSPCCMARPLGAASFP